MDAADTVYDPWSPEFVADPYPAYAELRAAGRAHWHAPTRQWLIPHHEDVSALLRDRRLGRTYTHRFTHEEFGQEAPDAAYEPFHTLNDHGLLDLEAADHGRIRRLVSKAFTPRTVENLAPTVRRLAADLVGGLVAAAWRRSPGLGRGAAAGRGDRRDAGRPGRRRGAGTAASLVGGDLRDVRAEPLEGDGPTGGRGLGRVLGLSAGADRAAAGGNPATI